jgi:hypothetical protein
MKTGNIAGGVLGLNTIFGVQWYFPLLLGIIAFGLLLRNYECWKGLSNLVVVMGVYRDSHRHRA